MLKSMLVLLVLLASNQNSAFATTRTITMCQNTSGPNEYSYVFVPLDVNANGTACKHSFQSGTGRVTGDCFYDADTEKVIAPRTVVIHFELAGRELLNVPINYRKLKSFKATYWHGNWEVPSVNIPLKAQKDDYKILDCNKVNVTY